MQVFWRPLKTPRTPNPARERAPAGGRLPPTTTRIPEGEPPVAYNFDAVLTVTDATLTTVTLACDVQRPGLPAVPGDVVMTFDPGRVPTLPVGQKVRVRAELA